MHFNADLLFRTNDFFLLILTVRNIAISLLLLLASVALFATSFFSFVTAAEQYRLETLATESTEKRIYRSNYTVIFGMAVISMYFSAIFLIAFVYYICYQRPAEKKKAQDKSSSSSKEKEHEE